MEYEIGADESVSTAVRRAVSIVEGRDTRSLRPLSDVLDPNALDSLFEVRSNGRPRIGGQLSFIYSNCVVTIDNGEYLSLELLDTARYERQERKSSHRHPE